MRPIQDAFALLQSPKKIFITSHHKPDGDAIGSMLGLYHYLTKKGHSPMAITPSEPPDFLKWMPGAETLLNFEADPEKCLNALADSDLIICVDFNDLSRTKHIEEPLAKATQPKIMIDHHLSPSDVWEYGVSVPEKSSTAEMIYDFINLCGDNDLIDDSIARCLYTGVLTDTGSFRFASANATAHEMVADLKHKGLAHSPIHEAIYDTWTHDRMRFLGYVLLERMETISKYNTGVIALSRRDIDLFRVRSGDTEGLVNYPMSVAGVRFSALITEHPTEVKLSFRSKGDFDVSSFARLHFDGGGHFNAAGGRSKTSFIETIGKFKRILSDIHPR